MTKVRVYQFRCGDHWIDYTGWLWCNLPRNERRVIYR